MKTGLITLILGIVLFVLNIVECVRYDYKGNKEFYTYWDLTKMAPTIDDKITQLNLLTDALNKSGLQGKYGAVWFKLPSNSFDTCFTMVHSYQTYLKNLQCLELTSFEYQTAFGKLQYYEKENLQQAMSVICSIWYKDHMPLLWNWTGWLNVIVSVLLIVIGWVILANRDY